VAVNLTINLLTQKHCQIALQSTCNTYDGRKMNQYLTQKLKLTYLKTAKYFWNFTHSQFTVYTNNYRID